MATPSFSGSEFVVNTTTVGIQSNASIAGLANGKFVAVWQDDSLADPGGSATIRTQLYNADGSKLGSEFITNGNEVSSSIQPSVTALSGGRYVVAWTNTSPTDAGDGSDSSVKGRVFNSDGSPAGNEFFINQVTQLSQGDVSIAALADGGFAASWGHDSGSADLDIRGRTFNADGTPRTALEVAIDGSLGLEVNSSTAGLVGGGFVTVWTDSGGGGETDGDGSHIRAQRFDANGADVGDEFIVNFSTTDDQFDPTVVALANGGFAVAWTHNFDANDTDAIVRIFNANGLPLTQDVFIDGDFNTNEAKVSMTALPDGNLFVAWQDAGGAGESDGSGAHIRGKVISGVNGGDVSDEIVINTTVPFDQLQPSVTVLTDGRVVVSWTDASQQGSAAEFDVRAQIIDPRTAAVNLVGTAAADDWVGTGFADTMKGLGGNDVMKGGAGEDRLEGGAGNDTYFVDNARDRTIEGTGQGTEDVVATSVSYALGIAAQVETLRTTSNGSTAAIDLTGNGFGQLIIGNAGENTIRGGGGTDVLNGLGGNDTYFVDSADDVVIEGAGQGTASLKGDLVAASVSYALGDAAQVETLRTTSNGGTTAMNLVGNGFAQTIIGNAAANILKGLGGNDDLQGLGGADNLQGGDGNDELTGGLGLDTLTGGAGKDAFFFDDLAESGVGSGKRDIIADFVAGDSIVVSGITGGVEFFKLDAGGAFVAGEIHQTVSGGNLVIDFNVDGDAAAEMSLLLTGQASPLFLSDFVQLD